MEYIIHDEHLTNMANNWLCEYGLNEKPNGEITDEIIRIVLVLIKRIGDGKTCEGYGFTNKEAQLAKILSEVYEIGYNSASDSLKKSIAKISLSLNQIALT